ncbi:hypothetical protein O6H91_11G077000 [Diphasiastrum complanatum]|uniref:Uncharacterized protein n=7 Tax=Diphasiastrum complanatum TaxID=34168 RepID=A0ACC2CAM9_DIPCM|nr:hypothetical protein O6H91_11G077000 [Diphasiastrum complanatum]KAJ7539093.1 hypothetical protein O6H91_11G077000 [Diphasiastrum complanatum]KAJ7539096.1 hypothetical protein O6H91_11G077000 [Diphasiastrum complanatum]KAJ7539098.1 hypothetical protein O6H91_11G077000 [Diphasiastrum complanatum]KAJ7539099.1 hypothetical protein O6H91_11G077000 [Diphasiastrum complanatum]
MAQCYTERKHLPAGTLNSYNGGAFTSSMYGSNFSNDQLEHFHQNSMIKDHRRTSTSPDDALPGDRNGINRSFNHVPRMFGNEGISKETDVSWRSRTNYENINQLSIISNANWKRNSHGLSSKSHEVGVLPDEKDVKSMQPRQFAGGSFAAGTLRDFGNFASSKNEERLGMPLSSRGHSSESNLKREDMLPAESKLKHSREYQNRAYEIIRPNLINSLERISEEQEILTGQGQSRSKGNSVSKIKSIPKPYGAITGKEALLVDEHFSGSTTKFENSSVWASVGEFATKSFEGENTITGGRPRVVEHKSSSPLSGILDRSDLRAARENLSGRPRSRNLSEGNSGMIIAGEDPDFENNLSERRLSVGVESPTHSRGSKTSAAAAGIVRPTHANRNSSEGACGGGMYTGESSRWGTSETKLTYAGSHLELVYEGNRELNSRFITLEMSSADRGEGGFYAGVFGAGLVEKNGNRKQSFASSPRITSVSEKLSNEGESGNCMDFKSERRTGETSDDKVRSKNLNDGRFTGGCSDVKGNFAIVGSSSETSFTKVDSRVENSSAIRSNGRCSTDENVGSATRTNLKTANFKEDDHSTAGRFYEHNSNSHPNQETPLKENGSDHRSQVAADVFGIGNISLAGKSLLLKKAFSSKDAEGVKKIGNEQYKKGHFAEALSLYEKAISLQPSQASYHSNKAAALSALGRLVDAVQECKEAIRLDPSYLRARRRLVSLFLRLGQIEDAKKQFYAAGEQINAGDMQQIQNVEKQIVKCFEARKATDWQTILRETDAAVLAGADSAPKVLVLKAEALLSIHRPDEAAQVLSTAQKLETALTKAGLALPDSTVFVVQAQLDMSQGRYEEALIAAQKAAQIHPNNAAVSAFLKKLIAVLKARKMGNKLFTEGKYFEASAAYGAGLEADSANAVLLCNRAACRSNIGLWEKSIEDCNAALEAQPTYIKARLRRAHSYAKLEKWEEALRDFEAVRRELPGDVDIAQALFDVQLALQKSRGEEKSKAQFGGEVEKVSSIDQFSRAINSPGLAVVQFITRWNERCKQFLPFLDQLCKRYPAVIFLTVDIEQNPYIAKLENASTVPTLKIYKDGQKLQELIGSSHQELEHAVQYYTQ